MDPSMSRKDASSLTIDPLKSTTWWGVYVVTVGTVQLHRIQAWHIRAAARHYMAANTKDTGTGTKLPCVVLFHLVDV
jgi:hypothetical protein